MEHRLVPVPLGHLIQTLSLGIKCSAELHLSGPPTMLSSGQQQRCSVKMETTQGRQCGVRLLMLRAAGEEGTGASCRSWSGGACGDSSPKG